MSVNIENTVRQWIFSTTREIEEAGKSPARLARLHTLEDVLMAIETGGSDGE